MCTSAYPFGDKRRDDIQKSLKQKKVNNNKRLLLNTYHPGTWGRSTGTHSEGCLVVDPGDLQASG
uniref:SFRICE_015775 n=1 Tax=Spodoptera frugiperda TaxID=7108 RepID=A0A2H1WI30_SPOFR